MFNGKNKAARSSETEAPEEKSSASAEAKTAPVISQNFPLFFSHPVAVNSERHAKAGINMSLAPSFARATNSIPINAAEYVEAVKYYPIVFTVGDPIMSVAIVGLEQENLFIDKDGKWQENTYVPAYVRKHPFVFAEEEGSERLTLCVDEDSQYFVKNATGSNMVKLFEKGEPTSYTNQALNFCVAYQEQYMATRQFCTLLKELDLLEPYRSDIELNSGRKIALGGFQLLDQKKLSQLPENKIVELHRQGWLPLMYQLLLASSNWRRLLDIASAREKK